MRNVARLDITSWQRLFFRGVCHDRAGVFADLIGHGPREEVGDIVRWVAAIGGDGLHIHFEEMANIDVVHVQGCENGEEACGNMSEFLGMNAVRGFSQVSNEAKNSFDPIIVHWNSEIVDESG